MRIIEFLPEGKVKDLLINREFDRAHSKEKVKFGIYVNGKLWKKNHIPVSFDSYHSALQIANRITAVRNITTQVVQIK